MLYVQDKVVKLGGVYLKGQVTSVEVQEAGSVYVAQDEKGRFKKSQPVGYENAKVMIDILLEDTKKATTLEQLTEMQRLFKHMVRINPSCSLSSMRTVQPVAYRAYISRTSPPRRSYQRASG